MSNESFKILSIDGGGIRGVYSAHILKRIEEEFKIKLHDYFDLIAGTSTGSIIAAAIACDISLNDVEQLYKDKGDKIFSKKVWWKFPKWFSSKFHSEELNKILVGKFGDRTLGDISKPLILPASNITTGKVYVSKSYYDKNFVRDKRIKLTDAILASCSAPTYFDPHCIGSYLLADGGLWANNPSLVAVIDAKKRLHQKLENIKIFSIGTGLYKPEFDFKAKRMGFLTGWKRSKLIDFILSLQSQSTDNYLGLLLAEKQKYRINFESSEELPLDKSISVNKLIAKADEDFTYNTPNLKNFLELKEQNNDKLR